MHTGRVCMMENTGEGVVGGPSVSYQVHKEITLRL